MLNFSDYPSYFKHYKQDGDINLDEQEEKARLIAQVMELQNTLDGNKTIIFKFSKAIYKIYFHHSQISLKEWTVSRKKT